MTPVTTLLKFAVITVILLIVEVVTIPWATFVWRRLNVHNLKVLVRLYFSWCLDKQRELEERGL